MDDAASRRPLPPLDAADGDALSLTGDESVRGSRASWTSPGRAPPPRDAPARAAPVPAAQADLVLEWTARDVERFMRQQDEDGLCAAWFSGVSGAELLEVLHAAPDDMHETLGFAFTGGCDEDAKTVTAREARLKPLRAHVVSQLRKRPGRPDVPRVKVRALQLERTLFRAAWRAVATRAARAVWGPESAHDFLWDPKDARAAAAAARVIEAYAGETLAQLAANLALDAGAALDARRRADALRLALSPRGVAAAYAWRNNDEGTEDRGKQLYRAAVANLAAVLHAAARGLGTLLEGADVSAAVDYGATVSLSENDKKLRDELFRTARAALGALCALCPLKASFVASGANGVGGRVSTTNAAGEAMKQLDVVCSATLAPLVFLLERAAPFGERAAPFGESATDVAGDVESLRSPVAYLLYLLSWHEDNLVRLYQAGVRNAKNIVVTTALAWLQPLPGRAKNASSALLAGRGQHADVAVRQRLATLIWNLVQKKERAVDLAVPTVLHPLLRRLRDADEQRDVHFAVAGAIEYLVSHRGALVKLFQADTLHLEAAHFQNPAASKHRGHPPLLEAVLAELQPTMRAVLFGTQLPLAPPTPDQGGGGVVGGPRPRSSGSLQLKLAACANLANLGVACAVEQKALTERLRGRLDKALAYSAAAPLRLEASIAREPELQEQRVRFEAVRLLWGLLRLQLLPAAAGRALLAATLTLDVECASAGVIFDNVPPADLKLHTIQDLIRVVGAGACDADEPLRTFAAWMLAHFTARGADQLHVANQDAFESLTMLIANEEKTSLCADFCGEKTAVCADFCGDRAFVDAARHATLRLVSRVVRNLAKNELTASQVAVRAKRQNRQTHRDLHALNKLAMIGWGLEKARFEAGDAAKEAKEAIYVRRANESYHKELAKHDTWLDASGLRHHRCVPFAVVDVDDDGATARARRAAKDSTIEYVEPAAGAARRPSEYAADAGYSVVRGCLVSSIRVLDEAAAALEHLAAHKDVRSHFAAHGSLATCTALAVDGRFRAGVALEVLFDAPREALVHGVTLLPRPTTSYLANVAAGAAPDEPRALHDGNVSARWLAGDVFGLVVETIAVLGPLPHFAARRRESNFGAAADALLALQLVMNIVSHDVSDHAPRHHAAEARADEARANSDSDSDSDDEDDGGSGDEAPKTAASEPIDGFASHGAKALRGAPRAGEQVVVLDTQTRELQAGTCSQVHLVRPRGRLGAACDVQLDTGHALPCVAAATRGDHFALRGGDISAKRRPRHVVFRASAAVVGASSEGKSIFLHFAAHARHVFPLLEGCCEHSATLAAAVFDLCEALADASRRYLLLGNCGAAEILLSHLGPFCVARLVKDVASALPRNAPLFLAHDVYLANGESDSLRRRDHVGQLAVCTFLLKASVQMYRKGARFLEAGGNNYALATIIDNALLALNVQLFDADLGYRLSAAEQRHVLALVGDCSDSRKTGAAVLSSNGDGHVSGGDVLLAATFRTMLTVLDLARHVDAHDAADSNGEQATLLHTMLHGARGPAPPRRGAHFAKGAPSLGSALGNSPMAVVESVRGRRAIARVLLGADCDASPGGGRDEPLFAALRNACCEIVALDGGHRGDGMGVSMRAATRESLRLLVNLGQARLVAEQRAGGPVPTLEPAFVRALVCSLEQHPGRNAVSRALSVERRVTDALVATEACRLTAMLAAHLDCRLRLVFPEMNDAADSLERSGARILIGPEFDAPAEDDAQERLRAHSSPKDGDSGDAHSLLAAVRAHSRGGCVAALTALAAQAADASARVAAVSALRAICTNSTVCREAICAHDGVRALVKAAHLGDAKVRQDVAFIFSELALTPVTREALIGGSTALLLLLRFQNSAGVAGGGDHHAVAHADRALKYFDEKPALVYLMALRKCAQKIDSWTERRRAGLSTVGLELLRPGYDELLAVALCGVEDAAAHSATARLLIDAGAVKPLMCCLRVRSASTVAAAARALGALVNHMRPSPQTTAVVQRVADLLVLLTWPLAHRAARTLQFWHRQGAQTRRAYNALPGSPIGSPVASSTDSPHDAATIALVPVSAALVGVCAYYLERADNNHDVGTYLVQHGAIDALVARLTPDWHRHDEDHGRPRPALDAATVAGVVGEARLKRRPRVAAARDEACFDDASAIVKVLKTIAHLSLFTPTGSVYGRAEHTLSLLAAFHTSKRCRELAMLALRRIRPSLPPASRYSVHEAGAAFEDRVAPLPPDRWDAEDAVTWLGCVGFGRLGRTMRDYLQDETPPEGTATDGVGRALAGRAVRGTLQDSRRWAPTRSMAVERGLERSRRTAGHRLLALSRGDLERHGAFGDAAARRGIDFVVATLAAELRDLHLRMRETRQPETFDVRLPQALVGQLDAAKSKAKKRAKPVEFQETKEPWGLPRENPLRRSNSAFDLDGDEPFEAGHARESAMVVILTAVKVRRYRALLDETRDVMLAAGRATDAAALVDLAALTCEAARAAFVALDRAPERAAMHAARAKELAERLVDAVALHRVALAAGSAARTSMAPRGPADDRQHHGTLWFELSSSHDAEHFNGARAGEIATPAADGKAQVSSKDLPDAPITAALWPTEGVGHETALLRERKRSKKTSTGLLQRVVKEPVLDGRGISHLYEVNFIDARRLLGGGVTALMACARSGDVAMVHSLLDECEERLKLKVLMGSRKAARRLAASPTAVDAAQSHRATRSERRSLEVEVAMEPGNESDEEVMGPLGSLPPTMRASAEDDEGYTALHHALLTMLLALRSSRDERRQTAPGGDKHRSSAADLDGAVRRQVATCRVLLDRVALPFGAGVFRLTIASSSRPSRRGTPEALAVLLEAYALVRTAGDQDDEDAPEAPDSGRSSAAARQWAQVAFDVACQLDDLIACCFRCGADLGAGAVAVAERTRLLARTRILYVEHCRDTRSLRDAVRRTPDLFLRRIEGATVEDSVVQDCGPKSPTAKIALWADSVAGPSEAAPVKAPKAPWEEHLFSLKRLQVEATAVWHERMLYHQARHFLLQLGFLAIFLWVATEVVGFDVLIAQRDAVQQALRTRLVEDEWAPGNGFLDVATPADFWSWAEGPLLSSVYEPELPIFGRAAFTAEADKFPVLGGLGYVIGAPRLRMVASIADDAVLSACDYAPSEPRFGGGDACVAYYSSATELERDLGPAASEETPAALAAARALRHSEAAKGWMGLPAPDVHGLMGVSYPGSSGYVASFPRDADDGAELLARLKNASWVSRNTRAIVFEALVYTASDYHAHNLVVKVSLLAEFTPTGAVVCSGRIRALRLFLYQTYRDYARVVFEMLWAAAVGLQFRAEAYAMSAAFARVRSADAGATKQRGLSKAMKAVADYTEQHFNLFDLAHFNVLFVLIIVHLVSLGCAAATEWRKLLTVADDAAYYASKDALENYATANIALQLAEVRLTLLGVYVFLHFLKLLDHLRVSESLHVLIIEEMFKKISSFLGIVFIWILLFSLTDFYSRLGGALGPMGGSSQSMTGGETLVSTFFQVMKQLLGEFDFETAAHSDSKFGLVFNIFSLLILPVLLMNLLIAIMFEAYESVKEYAAARFCYLQLSTYAEYDRAHAEQHEAARALARPEPLHVLALFASCALFPLFLLRQVYNKAAGHVRFLYHDYNLVTGQLYAADKATRQRARNAESARTFESARSRSWADALRARAVYQGPTKVHPTTPEEGAPPPPSEAPVLKHGKW